MPASFLAEDPGGHPPVRIDKEGVECHQPQRIQPVNKALATVVEACRAVRRP
ncbi:MAG: hypothetical protein ACK587_03685 [Cyanobacteriota bacterium]|jgi:hypothetical protein